VEATVIDQIRIVLLDGFQRHPVERNIPAEMIAATASWAIYGAVKQWVNTANRVSAEEFVAVAVELVRPIVMAGVSPSHEFDGPHLDAPTTASQQHS
jgi:hypothetical protein